MFLSFSQIPVLSFSQPLPWLEASRQVLTLGHGLQSCRTIREGCFIAACISLLLTSIRRKGGALSSDMDSTVNPETLQNLQLGKTNEGGALYIPLS